MSKSNTAIESAMEIMEQLGTQILDLPERMADTVRMKCACGNLHTSSLNLKMRQVKKMDSIEGGKLSCSECYVRGPKKTDRTDAEIRKELLDDHNILLGERTGNTKAIHKFKCLTCESVWDTSIVAVFQSKRKYGTTGCPTCSKNAVDMNKRKHSETLTILAELGYRVTSDYVNAATRCTLIDKDGNKVSRVPGAIIQAHKQQRNNIETEYNESNNDKTTLDALASMLEQL